ncbi:cell division protein ZapA [candidate division GN15 bacterium]|nr:cell division protein ZapA [candidate division GN15 bacterium]
MVSDENRIVVRIFGEEYPIAGSGDPAYISRIADLVDSRMQEVSERSQTKARDKVAILAALSLASELYEKSEKLKSMSDSSDTTIERVLTQLDQALVDDTRSGS